VNCEYVSEVVGVVCTNAGTTQSRMITSQSSQSQRDQLGGCGGALPTGLSPGGGVAGLLLMGHSYLLMSHSEHTVGQLCSRRELSSLPGAVRDRQLIWLWHAGRPFLAQLRAQHRPSAMNSRHDGTDRDV
jgi:hypothetical protein